MKCLTLPFAVFCLALAFPALADSRRVIRCEQEAPNAMGETVSYQVWEEGNGYALAKYENEQEIARVGLSYSQAVMGYGGTYLFTGNQGRSGFFLLYYHRGENPSRDKALIEVNLFQPGVRLLNTDGPRADFLCKAL